MIKREIIRYSDTDRYIDADWLYSRERQEDGEINQIVWMKQDLNEIKRSWGQEQKTLGNSTRILWEDIKNNSNTKKSV